MVYPNTSQDVQHVLLMLKKCQPFTAELRTSIHKKHRLWNRWISSRNDTIYKDYKVTRNKVKLEMVKLLREEQDKISVDCKRNPKKNSGNISIKN